MPATTQTAIVRVPDVPFFAELKAKQIRRSKNGLFWKAIIEGSVIWLPEKLDFDQAVSVTEKLLYARHDYVTLTRRANRNWQNAVQEAERGGE